MYAVIKAGGHQYRVTKGEVLEIDRLEGQEGDAVTFDKVMMLGGETIKVGSPLIEGARVEAVIKEQKRAPKIIVFKKKRRQGYKRKRGHKQPLTLVEITGIQA